MSTDFSRFTPEYREHLLRFATPEEREEIDRLLWPSLPELESSWKVWLPTLFPQFTRGELAPFQIEYWDWLWAALMSKREGKPLPDGENSFMSIWSRAAAKSTHARLAPIAEAALLKTGYCLYLGRSQDTANQHLSSIETLLTSDRVRYYYPQLARPRKRETDKNKAWNQKMLHLENGYVIQAVGLDVGVRGANIDDMRVTLLVPDDIDDISDTALQSEQKMDKFLHSVLPTKKQGTLFVCAQNLVLESGVINRIVTGDVPALANARISGPHPRVRNLVTEQQTVKGRQRDIVISGEVTWPGNDSLERVQEDIDTFTLPVFLKECHPAGTLIRTQGHSNVPIERIAVGDSVTTHLGHQRKVYELVRRDYSGDLFEIKRSGRSGVLRATAQHPVYVGRRPKFHDWYPAVSERTQKIKYEWAAVSSLDVGDFLLEPLPPELSRYVDGSVVWTFYPNRLGRPVKANRDVVATPELCRLLGYFLAEGSCTPGTSFVTFHFHSDETEYHADVVDLLTQVFGDVSVRVEPDGPENAKATVITCNSAVVNQFFQQTGRYSQGKRVPDWVFLTSKKLIAEVVTGYMRGDGSKDFSGFTFNTISEGLAEDIRLLMLRLDVIAKTYAIPPRTVRLPQGTLYDRGKQWMGDISGNAAVLLGDILGVPHKESPRLVSFIANGYAHYPIKAISSYPVTELPVFNLEVEEDHSYLAENVASHNCQHELHVDRSGLVLTPWVDKIHVITEEEFESIFHYPRVPAHWPKEVAHDWSNTKSAYHANIVFKLAVSPQNEPLPGCLFIYDPMSFEPNTQADDVAIRILKSIAPEVLVKGVIRSWDDILRAEFERYNLEQFVNSATALIRARRDVLAKVIPPLVGPLLKLYHYRRFRMSHEAADQRNVYRRVYGLPFTGINPRKEGGLEFARHYLRVDPTRRHPFKDMMGWSQTYVVVPNEKKGYPVAIRSDTLHDSDLLRFQFAHWRYAEPHLTANGILDQGPQKLHDDFGNGLQMALVNGGLLAEPLTYNEKVEELIPPDTRLENLMQVSPTSLTGRKTMTAAQQLSYDMARHIAKGKLPPRRARFDEYYDAY